MKRFRYCFLVLLLMSTLGFSQGDWVFDNYDVSPFDNPTYQDSIIFSRTASTDTSWLRMSLETTTVHEGTGALKFDYGVEISEVWGGFVRYDFWNPDTNGTWDLSPFDTLSLWYYIEEKCSTPGQITFRLLFYDVSDVDVNTYDGNATERWYSFHYILDADPGWHEIRMPLIDAGPAAQDGSKGFWNPAGVWGGVDVEGNKALDLDKIKGIGFEFSTKGGTMNQLDSGVVIFDRLAFVGSSNYSVVFFNGKTVNPQMKPFDWPSGTSGIVEGAGADGMTNAYAWYRTAVWGGWCGFGFEFRDNPKNLQFVWDTDTLKFMMKAPAGVGVIRVSMEDADTTKMYYELQPPANGYDDTWMQVKVALKDINIYDPPPNGSASTNNGVLDKDKIVVLHIYAPGNAKDGETIYFDNIWTGNPVIDVIPPDPPTAVQVFPDQYYNLVTWLDVAGETGEVYNIYYSENQFANPADAGVNAVDMALHVAEGTQQIEHLLFSPLGDSTVTYYYGVTAVDAFGNESDPGLSAVVTNTAKGIPTISMNPPANFVADGDLSEWADITPFEFSPSNSHQPVNISTFDDDADLNARIYLAMDDTYLYFAYDANDDFVDTTSGNTWEKDSPDLFLGLYNLEGKPHTSYNNGNAADYHFRFLPTHVLEDYRQARVLELGDDYKWQEKLIFSGFTIEARIPLATLASIAGGEIFKPVEGYRIPFDAALNDADGTGAREGILTWSPYNDDTSWKSPKYWLYTWLGTKMHPLGVEDGQVALSYDLKQNYPNPFNPTTTIQYSIQKPGHVALTVYNSLGQKVATLYEGFRNAGNYTAQFNATDLPSGIYFYRLEAGNFIAVKKMLLVK
ncbi:MAG: T9SS C-terminal target domain-containing protein [Methanobacteriota archaeon]|nr:MAG: T9SS C-terminal target domain-containing protein [Euryarchaeota archaeon]